MGSQGIVLMVKQSGFDCGPISGESLAWHLSAVQKIRLESFEEAQKCDFTWSDAGFVCCPVEHVLEEQGHSGHGVIWIVTSSEEYL